MSDYTCDSCGGEFQTSSSQTEEGRKEEVRKNFGVAHQKDDAVVCDDCYWKILLWLEKDRVREHES